MTLYFSGAVIDSNLVNFSLPKKTAKVDKKFNDLKPSEKPKPLASTTNNIPQTTTPATVSSPKVVNSSKIVQGLILQNNGKIAKLEMSISQTDESNEVDVTSITTPKTTTPLKSPETKKSTTVGSNVKKNRNVIILPKSSRREVKVPLKYRDEEETESKKTSPQTKKVKSSPSINEKSHQNKSKEDWISQRPEKEVATKITSSPPKTIAFHKKLNHEELKGRREHFLKNRRIFKFSYWRATTVKEA